MNDLFWPQHGCLLDTDKALVWITQLPGTSCARYHRALPSCITSKTSKPLGSKLCFIALATAHRQLARRMHPSPFCTVHLFVVVHVLTLVLVSFSECSPARVLRFPTRIKKTLFSSTYCQGKIPGGQSSAQTLCKVCKILGMTIH